MADDADNGATTYTTDSGTKYVVSPDGSVERDGVPLVDGVYLSPARVKRIEANDAAGEKRLPLPANVFNLADYNGPGGRFLYENADGVDTSGVVTDREPPFGKLEGTVTRNSAGAIVAEGVDFSGMSGAEIQATVSAAVPSSGAEASKKKGKPWYQLW